jgi:hypothetical protein
MLAANAITLSFKEFIIVGYWLRRTVSAVPLQRLVKCGFEGAAAEKSRHGRMPLTQVKCAGQLQRV